MTKIIAVSTSLKRLLYFSTSFLMVLLNSEMVRTMQSRKRLKQIILTRLLMTLMSYLCIMTYGKDKEKIVCC